MALNAFNFFREIIKGKIVFLIGKFNRVFSKTSKN